jgi:hypothetical protein
MAWKSRTTAMAGREKTRSSEAEKEWCAVMIEGKGSMMRIGLSIAIAALYAGGALAQGAGTVVDEEFVVVDETGVIDEVVLTDDGVPSEEGTVTDEGEPVVYEYPGSNCGGCEAWTGVPVDVSGVIDEVVLTDEGVPSEEGTVTEEGEPVVYDNPESTCGGCEAWTGVPINVSGVPDPRRDLIAKVSKSHDVAYRGPEIAPAGNICTTPELYVAWLCTWQGYERP